MQRILQQGSVCYLPIKIIYSSGKTEQTGIFTSLLTGGIATCVLPPADTKIRIGSEYCKLQYSFSSIIKCDPPESVGCCEVAFNLRWFWKTIPVKFCYNSASPILCTLINKWLECLGLEGSAEWTDGGICNHEIKECVTETPTAVEIASFSAIPANGSVTLSWQTGDEADTFGFNIYRAEDAAGVYTKINSALIYAQAGVGTGADYIYVDSAVSNLDTYYYKLEGVHNDGSSSMSKTAYATPRLIYDIVK
jgi:hypothetical protein